MSSIIAERVRSNADFAELQRVRGSFSRLVCGAMLVIYFGFIALVAFRPDITSMQVGGGITLAFPLGIGVILSAIILTGVYVIRANGEFDRLTARIAQDVR